MSAQSTVTEAFARFGVTPRNQRWSWSGRSEDGRLVVLMLWSDLFAWKAKPIIYGDDASSGNWTDRLGNRERLGNLIWARDNCEGHFRVILVTAVNPKASPRTVAERIPREGWVMRITKLDESTGEFAAEMVEPPVAPRP